MKKKNLIEKFLRINNGYVLDVGTGTGAFLSAMKQNGWSVTGLEPRYNCKNKSKRLI